MSRRERSMAGTLKSGYGSEGCRSAPADTCRLDTVRAGYPALSPLPLAAQKWRYYIPMKKGMFIKAATVVFSIVGVVHLYRAINDLPVLFNTWLVPVSLSWFVALLALLLAYSGFRFWNK